MSETVPRILHQIWIGTPPPPQVRDNWELWEDTLAATTSPARSAGAGADAWTIEHWTDQRIADTPELARIREQLDTTLSIRAITDILRVAIVHAHGGVYMDSDAYPTTPEHADTLAGPDTPAWVGDRPAPAAIPQGTLCNGFFGAPAHHPFLAAVRQRAAEQMARGIRDDHHIAGPRTFRHIYEQMGADPATTPDQPLLRRTFLVGHRGARAAARGTAPYDQADTSAQHPDATVVHP